MALLVFWCLNAAAEAEEAGVVRIRSESSPIRLVSQPPELPADDDDFGDPATDTEQESNDDATDEEFSVPSGADPLLPSFGQDDLLPTRVSTVTLQESTIGKSPAAVFVITPEMIRRSGVTKIPDLLRMVPGVQVARIDANKWAVTARGFNSRFANKLQVQMDGRSIYTPLFGGVFWDAHDVVLEDIDRIEVIRGPGASIWGANAVNGVINIITKHAKDTQGGLITSGGGTEVRANTSARYGAKIGDNLYFRTYFKHLEQHEGAGKLITLDPLGVRARAADDWRSLRGGFRADWDPEEDDTVTIQGEAFTNDLGSTEISPLTTVPIPIGTTLVPDQGTAHGGNLGGRWTHKTERGDVTVQSYYDFHDRTTTLEEFNYRRDSFDVSLQNRAKFGRHLTVVGAQYQWHKDRMAMRSRVQYDPSGRTYDVISGFVQDEIDLFEDELKFIAGVKLEHNDFSNFEYQPSTRFVWTPDNRQAIWGALSRAIRRPSRQDHDGGLIVSSTAEVTGVTPWLDLQGNSDFMAEELLATELGYRRQVTEDLVVDLATFYNKYDQLTSFRPAMLNQLVYFNDLAAESYGAELMMQLQVTDRWMMRTAYTFLRVDTRPDSIATTERSSPRNSVDFRSSWDVTEKIDVDLAIRFADELPDIAPRYIVGDIRVAFRPKDNVEIAVVGRNLFEKSHLEYSDPVAAFVRSTEVDRGVFGTLSVQW